MKKTLRLLVTEKCNKNCEGCCNKDWDLKNLPIATHFNYDEILITGGEPLLDIEMVLKVKALLSFFKYININPKRKIYVYTSKPSSCLAIQGFCDGITISLHNNNDLFEFLQWRQEIEFMSDSLRLNVFKGIELPNINFDKWKIKKDIEWIKNCPLPINEEFKRLEFLF